METGDFSGGRWLCVGLPSSILWVLAEEKRKWEIRGKGETTDNLRQKGYWPSRCHSENVKKQIRRPSPWESAVHSLVGWLSVLLQHRPTMSALLTLHFPSVWCSGRARSGSGVRMWMKILASWLTTQDIIYMRMNDVCEAEAPGPWKSGILWIKLLLLILHKNRHTLLNKCNLLSFFTR